MRALPVAAVDVIVTHDVSDFDGIAAAVAARKLYPNAVMLRRRILAAEVRAYLAVHGGRFEFVPFQEVDQAAVHRFVMVDVRRRSRLEPDFAMVLGRADRADLDVELHVYDHHPDSHDDVHGVVEAVHNIGAVTTLFTELLRERRLEVDPIEATLFALGIHSDTGSLTFSNTDPRDVEAVAWLMRQGANLELVTRFLRPQFDDPQRELLSRFLSELDIVRIGTDDVGIAVLPLRRSVNGMPLVTTLACQLSAAGAVFGVFPIGSHRVQIIGRSEHGSFDVGSIMKSLGGGGHSDAGSTTVRGMSVAEVKSRLLVELERRAERRPLAARLMRPPQTDTKAQRGRTLGLDANFDDLVMIMARRHIDRVPIVDGRTIVGVIHREDLMEALYRDTAAGADDEEPDQGRPDPRRDLERELAK